MDRQLTFADTDCKVQNWLDHSEPNSDNEEQIANDETSPHVLIPESCLLCHTSSVPLQITNDSSSIVHHVSLCKITMKHMLTNIHKMAAIFNANTEVPSSQTNRIIEMLAKLNTELEIVQNQLDEDKVVPSI